MRLYAVDPAGLEDEAEGEDLREWFTSERVALRYARACIAEMEAEERTMFRHDHVTVTKYETQMPITVKWIASVLSHSLGGPTWHVIEEIADYRATWPPYPDPDLVDALEASE